MKRIVAVTLIMMLILSGCSTKDVANLNDSAFSINLDVNGDELSVLDESIVGKRIFLTGESHGSRSNGLLQMKFLKYFKEKTDFKYLLCEFSYSGAYYANKYLNTGDISYLDLIFHEIKGTYFYNEDKYQFYLDLYDYNQSLPEEQRITVVGVDLEHQPNLALFYLQEILKGKESSSNIAGTIDEIKGMKAPGYEREKFSSVSEKWLEDIEENEEAYKELLGTDFKGFKHVITNNIYLVEAKNADNWNDTRDAFIYSNFLNVVEELDENAKFYGQWGLNHIYQHAEKDVTWFATYLNSEESAFNNKVLSIAYQYEDCEFMTKKNGNYGTQIRSDILFPLAKRTQISKDNSAVLFPLEKESGYLYGKKDYGSISDYIQWVVHIKDQEASIPLNK